MTLTKGKPFYVKLHRLAPNTHDHNIVVKVISERIITDSSSSDGKRVFHAQYVVADDTGSVLLDLHEDHNLVVDSVIALHNARTQVIRDRMRLKLGKWGSIESTTRTIRGHVVTEPNYSEVDYSTVVPLKPEHRPLRMVK